MCRCEFSINSSSVNKVDQGLFTRSISECELREIDLYFDEGKKMVLFYASSFRFSELIFSDEDEKNLTKAWLRTKGNSIEGGTSEVQLNVISKRVLDLPS